MNPAICLALAAVLGAPLGELDHVKAKHRVEQSAAEQQKRDLDRKSLEDAERELDYADAHGKETMPKRPIARMQRKPRFYNDTSPVWIVPPLPIAPMLPDMLGPVIYPGR
jgi:hypothetical protein